MKHLLLIPTHCRQEGNRVMGLARGKTRKEGYKMENGRGGVGKEK